MSISKISVISMLLLLMLGCSSNGEQTYSHDEANRIQTTLTGTIKNIEKVNIDGTSSWKGTLTGSVLGGVLGSTIGNGWGRLIASAAGSIAGGFAGAATEEQLTKDQGFKITVEQSDGNTFAVVFVPEKGQSFTVGQRVKVMTSSSGKAKVYPL